MNTNNHTTKLMNKPIVNILMIALGLMTFSGCGNKAKNEDRSLTEKISEVPEIRDVWSPEKANQWYKQWGWIRGANFNPSSAINQLETWQAASFDEEPLTVN